MKEEEYAIRPDCGEILNERDSWGLSRQDFDSSEINEINELIKNKKEQQDISLVYSILESKLKLNRPSKLLKNNFLSQPNNVNRYKYCSFL
jgi:hypothetical protein